MKNFIFQFFDENLLFAWFKDERSSRVKLAKCRNGDHLKWILYHFMTKSDKNRFLTGFFLVKMVLVLFKGTRTQKDSIWKNPLKVFCIGLLYDTVWKKKWKIYF